MAEKKCMQIIFPELHMRVPHLTFVFNDFCIFVFQTENEIAQLEEDIEN